MEIELAMYRDSASGILFYSFLFHAAQHSTAQNGMAEINGIEQNKMECTGSTSTTNLNGTKWKQNAMEWSVAELLNLQEMETLFLMPTVSCTGQ